MPLLDLFSDLNNRRKVKSHSRECRRSGCTDGMIAHALEVVCELARATADDDPTGQYLTSGANARIEQRLPGLDPATIMLLVQLAVLIYQALKAVGFLNREGLASVSPATITEHFGGL